MNVRCTVCEVSWDAAVAGRPCPWCAAEEWEPIDWQEQLWEWRDTFRERPAEAERP